MARLARGLSPTTADRDPVHGFLQRAAAGVDRLDPVLLAGRDRRVVDDDRLLQPGRHLLQPEIPVVAADRPAADPVPDGAARATAQLGLGDPGAPGFGDPRDGPDRSA